MWPVAPIMAIIGGKSEPLGQGELCDLFAPGVVTSQIIFRPLRGIVVLSAIATGLLLAWSASADQRDVALDAAIPAALQKASAPDVPRVATRSCPRLAVLV